MSVSAIVSVYKAGEKLRPKLQSLLAQTLAASTQLETVLVICSPENHPDWQTIIDWQNEHPRMPMAVIASPFRIPIYEAWNVGIKCASGDLIVNSNVDDLPKPEAYELMATTMGWQYDVVYGCWQCVTNFPANSIDNTPYLAQPGFYPMGTSPYGFLPVNHQRLAKFCHWSCGVMWRKSLHDIVGYFDSSFSICGDYDMWCRFVLGGARVYALPYALGYWHFDLGGSNASFSSPEQFDFENRRIHIAHDDALKQT